MTLLAANRQRRFVVMSGLVSLLLAFVPLSVAAAVHMVFLVVDGSSAYASPESYRRIPRFDGKMQVQERHAEGSHALLAFQRIAGRSLQLTATLLAPLC